MSIKLTGDEVSLVVHALCLAADQYELTASKHHTHVVPGGDDRLAGAATAIQALATQLRKQATQARELAMALADAGTVALFEEADHYVEGDRSVPRVDGMPLIFSVEEG